jgi:hypothetical protein
MAGKIEEKVSSLGSLELPFGKEVRLERILYESGMHLLRMRIREGKRHTVIELDPPTAESWGKILTDWADRCDPS